MGKLNKLRGQFSQNEIDGLLITSTYNRRYMTNFTGTAGVALITNDRALFITDFRYTEQASKQAEGFEIVQHSGPISTEVAEQVKKLGIKNLGFEQDHMAFSTWKTYKEAVEC